jgi:hypothetical protein
MARKSKIAIVVLSYNALKYARRMFRSAHPTTGRQALAFHARPESNAR